MPATVCKPEPRRKKKSPKKEKKPTQKKKAGRQTQRKAGRNSTTKPKRACVPRVRFSPCFCLDDFEVDEGKRVHFDLPQYPGEQVETGPVPPDEGFDDNEEHHDRVLPTREHSVHESYDDPPPEIPTSAAAEVEATTQTAAIAAAEAEVATNAAVQAQDNAVEAAAQAEIVPTKKAILEQVAADAHEAAVDAVVTQIATAQAAAVSPTEAADKAVATANVDATEKRKAADEAAAAAEAVATDQKNKDQEAAAAAEVAKAAATEKQIADYNAAAAAVAATKATKAVEDAANDAATEKQIADDKAAENEMKDARAAEAATGDASEEPVNITQMVDGGDGFDDSEDESGAVNTQRFVVQVEDALDRLGEKPGEVPYDDPVQDAGAAVAEDTGAAVNRVRVRGDNPGAQDTGPAVNQPERASPAVDQPAAEAASIGKQTSDDKAATETLEAAVEAAAAADAAATKSEELVIETEFMDRDDGFDDSGNESDAPVAKKKVVEIQDVLSRLGEKSGMEPYDDPSQDAEAAVAEDTGAASDEAAAQLWMRLDRLIWEQSDEQEAIEADQSLTDEKKQELLFELNARDETLQEKLSQFIENGEWRENITPGVIRRINELQSVPYIADDNLWPVNRPVAEDADDKPGPRALLTSVDETTRLSIDEYKDKLLQSGQLEQMLKIVRVLSTHEVPCGMDNVPAGSILLQQGGNDCKPDEITFKQDDRDCGLEIFTYSGEFTVQNFVSWLVHKSRSRIGFMYQPNHKTNIAGDVQAHLATDIFLREVLDHLATDIGTDQPVHIFVIKCEKRERSFVHAASESVARGNVRIISRFGNAHRIVDDQVGGLNNASNPKQIFHWDNYNGLRSSNESLYMPAPANVVANRHFQRSSTPTMYPKKVDQAGDGVGTGAGDTQAETDKPVVEHETSAALSIGDGALPHIMKLLDTMFQQDVTCGVEKIVAGAMLAKEQAAGGYDPSINYVFKYVDEFSAREYVKWLVDLKSNFGFIIVPTGATFGINNIKEQFVTDIGTEGALHIALMHCRSRKEASRQVSIVTRFGNAHEVVDDKDDAGNTKQLYRSDSYTGLRQSINVTLDGLDIPEFVIKHWSNPVLIKPRRPAALDPALLSENNAEESTRAATRHISDRFFFRDGADLPPPPSTPSRRPHTARISRPAPSAVDTRLNKTWDGQQKRIIRRTPSAKADYLTPRSSPSTDESRRPSRNPSPTASPTFPPAEVKRHFPTLAASGKLRRLMGVLKVIATRKVSSGYFSGIISVDDISDCAVNFLIHGDQAKNCGISGLNFTDSTPENTKIAPTLIGAVQGALDTRVAFVVTGLRQWKTIEIFKEYASVAGTLPRHFHLAVFDPENRGKVSLLTIHDPSGNANERMFVEHKNIDTTQWDCS